jgi:hypothetical protein
MDVFGSKGREGWGEGGGNEGRGMAWKGRVIG